ncbi:protein kinase [Pendulispora rubella]|uniref:Protein kinase n=1 Tax=Pendulispora rubella TaxID=2741070 RepID=A0ABZ2L2U2_9BACT
MKGDGLIETDITAVSEERLEIALRPGAVFGTRYALEERIASGRTGELFRALDLRLQRRVALKVLRHDVGSIAQARIAAALEHPNVVAIHDVGVREGMPFIAMEYVDGRPLRTFVGSAISVETKLAWMIEVARALAAAHEKGLVHGDIKPDNILICDDNGIVKVLDFGGAHVGTPGYMPPEQVRGEAVDAPVDQFAWGVVAYELFAGKLPTPTSPHLTNVPFEVAQVIARALSMRPESRYASMEEVVAALADPRLLGIHGMVRATKPQRLARWRSPRMWLPVLGAIAVAAGTLQLCGRNRDTPSSEIAASGAIDMPVTAIPLSPTCNKTAEIHYRRGLVSQREATWELARPAFEQAVGADPECKEAQLQLLITAYFRYSVTKEREQFRRVISMRDALSERDRALLDAWTPLVASEPANREEAARRFDAAVERYPRDAQILALAAMIHGFLALDTTQLERCVALARRAIVVDPKYGEAMQIMASALSRLGRHDEAMQAIDQCMNVAPGSGECLLERIRIQSLRGQCSEAVTSARKWISNVPTSSGAYRHLANTLASEGASIEAVETALQQWHNNHPDEGQRATYIYHRASLAAFYGNFVSMEELTKELIAGVEESATLFDHARAASMQVELLTETGRSAEAAAVAEQFLRRRDAWTEGFSITTPYEPAMFGVLLREGKISRERWVELSETWEKNALSTLSRQQAWGLRWGAALNPFYWQDQSDARELAATAWRMRPPPLPQGRSHEQPLSLGLLADAFQGRIALTTGADDAEAAQLFEPMAQNCHVLEQPFASVRTHQWMGEAKERLGDKDAACREYGIVLERWGEAKPRSTTATAARKRSEALGCK